MASSARSTTRGRPSSVGPRRFAPRRAGVWRRRSHPPPERRDAGCVPYWFYLPALIVFGVIFIAPTLLSFWYSLTRWTLFDAEFIGLDNFELFLREPSLTNGLRNTFVYAIVTSGLKVVLGLLLATL